MKHQVKLLVAVAMAVSSAASAAERSYDSTSTVSQPLVLTEDTTITVVKGATVTYDEYAVISGAYKLTKSGAGTLSLKAANTFSGGLNIAGGSVYAYRGDAVGVGDISYTASSTMPPKLYFYGTITCTNSVVLPDMQKCNWGVALGVTSDSDVSFTSPITITTYSWLEAAKTGVMRIKGGIGTSGTAYLSALGRIVIEETPLDVTSAFTPLIAKAGYTELAVAGNNLPQLRFKENGGLRLSVDNAFTGTPNVTLDGETRAGYCGGRIDLNGHDGAFGTLEVVACAYQAPLHILNTSETTATISFNQTTACEIGNIDFDGAISFAKRGSANLTVTNATFVVPGTLHLIEGRLTLSPESGAKIADIVVLEKGATLDLGGQTATCRQLSNYGGTVTNGTLSAETRLLEAPAGESVVIRMDEKLSAYYPFRSAATMGRDASANGNADLLPMGSPQFKSEGKFGGGVYFDGSTCLTNPPGVYFDSLPSGKTAYTVLAHVKNVSGKSGRALISLGSATGGGKMTALQIPSMTQIKNMVWSDKDVCMATLPNGTSLNDGNWHAIGASGEITNQILWADGVQIKNVAAGYTPDFAKSTFTIAGHLTYQLNFIGWADEVVVFRRNITTDEFEKYNQGGLAEMLRLSDQSLVSHAGAKLTVAGGADVVDATGPGTISTFGAEISGTVKACPTFEGNVTLADGMTFDLDGLGESEEGSIELLRMTNGTLTVAGQVNVVQKGQACTKRYRLYERNGSYRLRFNKGFVIQFK